MLAGDRYRVKPYKAHNRDIDTVGQRLDDSLKALDQTAVDQVRCSRQVSQWITDHMDLYVADYIVNIITC